MFVHNDEKLDLKHFGSESIERDVTVMSYQYSSDHPVYVMSRVHRDQLWDKTTFLNIGPKVEYDFTYLTTIGERASSWNVYFPADNKHGDDEPHYKFFGFQLNVNDDVYINRRVTYSFLNWLANIGGLRGWLQLAGTFLTGAFASMNLSGLMASRLYKWYAPDSFEGAVNKLNNRNMQKVKGTGMGSKLSA